MDFQPPEDGYDTIAEYMAGYLAWMRDAGASPEQLPRNRAFMIHALIGLRHRAQM